MMLSLTINLLFVWSDKQGVDLTAQQDTPVSGKKEDQYVIFNVPVHIQKPIDILPPGEYTGEPTGFET